MTLKRHQSEQERRQARADELIEASRLRIEGERAGLLEDPMAKLVGLGKSQKARPRQQQARPEWSHLRVRQGVRFKDLGWTELRRHDHAKQDPRRQEHATQEPATQHPRRQEHARSESRQGKTMATAAILS